MPTTNLPGAPLAPGQWGKFVASPWGEPTDGDDRARAFDTEAEASAYALEVVKTIGEPVRMEWLNTTPLLPFVVVIRFDEDTPEARETAREGWPCWTPYGWADPWNYHEGSFEDAASLWA